MIRYPLTDLLDEQECYAYLVRVLHPSGLRCPAQHPVQPAQAPHDRRRAPVVDYRCQACGAVFNVFTNTEWSGTHYDCITIVLLLRGFAQGIPTLQLAEELELDYGTLLERRHRLQGLALDRKPSTPLSDPETEGDEMFQNAGEKGTLHANPLDPPRRRANNRRGRGTLANDRPPIQGVVGRTSGAIRLTVCEDTKQDTIEPEVEAKTIPTTAFYTDESSAYNRVAESGRGHASVCHSQGEYARDDDGDGVREVHCNTMEGIWTGLRNFLRPFRGIHKKYLAQYVAMFEWAHNLKRVTADFLRALMLSNFTYLPT
jgi:transposase-like protein